LTDAVSEDHPDCLRKLINEGQDVNECYKRHYALIDSLNNNDNKCLDVLLRCENLNLEVKMHGITALCFAAGSGNDEAVIKLLNKGAKLNNDSWITVVDSAISSGRGNALRILLFEDPKFDYNYSLKCAKDILDKGEDKDLMTCYDILIKYKQLKGF